jgi:hypothetical protein
LAVNSFSIIVKVCRPSVFCGEERGLTAALEFSDRRQGWRGEDDHCNAIREELDTLTPGDRVLVIEDTQELLFHSANSPNMLATTEFDQL